MTWLLTVPSDPVDRDPWPRAAAVGQASAYGAVAQAREVTELVVSVEPAEHPLPPRRLTPLPTWDFERTRQVALPDCWSRRDPSLCDQRGPMTYARSVHAEGRARVVWEYADYLAQVLLDGTLMATHEGGFTPLAVEVPAGRDCRVEVVVHDPVEVGLAGVKDPLLEPKRKIKGVHEWHDSRPGGLAMGEPFDDVWTRRWGTGGLGAAALHETGEVRLDAVFATGTPGRLRLSFVVTSFGTWRATLLAVVPGATVVIEAVLSPGAQRVSVVLDVEGARPWSPDEPGVVLVRTGVIVGQHVSDTLDVPVAFRALRLAVEGPGRMQLHLDGKRRYVRAANYIPGVWSAELADTTVARDVALAKAAGLNSLGLHAGTCHPLYPQADEAGLLVYQDFPLQWSYDPAAGPVVEGGPSFAEADAFLTAELVYHLYNHPSLVLWCGHNEPAYQLAEAFASVQTPELVSLAEKMAGYPDEQACDLARRDRFVQLDPSRPALLASGLGASRPYGDSHDYTGSLSGGSATQSPVVPFLSEYGAWSASFSAAADLPGATREWPPPVPVDDLWHEQSHLFATQVTYAGRPERFPDFATWCFAGQLWAGWHAKVVTEKARLAQWAPSAGQRYHFFVDHFGAGGAGVLDRHRSTGPAYRGLAAANRPLVALAPVPGTGVVRPGQQVCLPITVVNDHQVPTGPLLLQWRLCALGPDDAFLVGADRPKHLAPLQDALAPVDQVCVLPRAEGRVLRSGQVDVEVGPNSSSLVHDITWTADVEGPVALFLDLEGVLGWTAFMVAPEGWTATPGLLGPSRFEVTSDERGLLRRRWTGEEVDAANAPPDQYVLGDRLVDVYDDTHLLLDGRALSNHLPWPDPLAGRAT